MKVITSYLVFFVLVASCSEYSKVVKGDDYKLKFETANALYEKKDFDRCIVLFEQIYQHSPKTGEGELAYYRLAKSYYETKDYYMAEYYFESYLSRFPFSPKIEESMFMKALCSVRNSPFYYLDQSETTKAINNVQDFVNRYPQSTLIDSCNQIIDDLRSKIELKDFEEVRLYDKTNNYRAAVTSAEIFSTRYARSKFFEENEYLWTKNAILLAQNSVDAKKQQRIDKAKERLLNFVGQFKTSNYLNELNSLMDKLDKGEKIK